MDSVSEINNYIKEFEVDDLFDMRSTQCMSESSLALLILGRSNTGKSNAAKEIVRKLHNKRNYGHFFLITSKASYLSSYNRVQNWCRRDQVLLWDDDDSISPTQRKDFFINLGKRILQWSSSGERTLLMVDDLTEHITDKSMNFRSFMTQGRHIMTDIILIMHDVPDARSSSQKHFKQYFDTIIVCQRSLLNHILENRLFGISRDMLKHYKENICNCASCHVRKFFVEANNRENLKPIFVLIRNSSGADVADVFVPFACNEFYGNYPEGLIRGKGSDEEGIRSIIDAKKMDSRYNQDENDTCSDRSRVSAVRKNFILSLR